MALDPDLLGEVAEFVVDILTPAADADWSVRAGTLDWSVDFTIEHMAGQLAKKTLYLASRSPRFIAVRTPAWTDARRRERIEAITDLSRGLIQVAKDCPAGTAVYHVSGMKTPEQYLASACEELLVHTHDVAEGLAIPYEPPGRFCRPVLATLAPEHADDPAPWLTLLWLNGRPNPQNAGRTAAPPLDKHERVPLEFAKGSGPGEWQPIRWVEPGE